MGWRMGTALAAAALIAGCGSDPTGVDACLEGGGRALTGGACMDVNALAGLDPAMVASIQSTVESTFDVVAGRIPLGPLRIVVDTHQGRVIPEVGTGGFAPSADLVFLSVDPGRTDIERVVAVELPRILAHELHHAARHAAAGYGSTLKQAMVSEGLADHFSLEIFGGAPPPWSTALADASLAEWRSAALQESGRYDHERWFFGADGTVPRWAGYAIGFDLVGRYLEADALRSASSLVGTPASEIIAGAGG